MGDPCVRPHYIQPETLRMSKVHHMFHDQRVLKTEDQLDCWWPVQCILSYPNPFGLKGVQITENSNVQISEAEINTQCAAVVLRPSGSHPLLRTELDNKQTFTSTLVLILFLPPIDASLYVLL